MKHKKLTALLAVLAVSALGVGALSYYSGTVEKKQNDFNIVAGQKDQNDAGTIKEPAQENGGKADAAAGLQPDQIVPKDPYIVSNVDQSAWAIMKVEVPKFTEAPNTGKPAAELLNVNADGKQKLLRELDDAEKHTVVYGYTEPLAGNNSTKPETERAKTSSLFDSFKITGDISLTNTYTGVIRVSGMLFQTEGNATVDDAAEGSGITPKSYAITYDLGENAVLSGQKTRYTADDYGYTPPEPTREGYKFTGWSPASIEDGKTGSITFTAQQTKKAATLMNGGQASEGTLNAKMNSIAKTANEDYTSITAFQHSDVAPAAKYMTDDNTISNDSSDAAIYCWRDGNALKWQSEAKKVYAPTNLAHLFINQKNLADISGIKDWDTSNVADMTRAFYGCSSLADLAPISNQNTSHVTTLEQTFDGDVSLVSLNQLANWDTSSVTTMFRLFGNCSGLKNIDALRSWKYDNVTNISMLVENATVENVNLSGLSFPKLENMNASGPLFVSCTFGDFTMDNIRAPKLTSLYNMFISAKVNNISMKNWSVPELRNLNNIFTNCKTVNIDGMDAPKLTAMQYAFGGSNLTNVSMRNVKMPSLNDLSFCFCGPTSLMEVIGLEDLDTSNVTTMRAMFGSCDKMTNFSSMNNQDITNVEDFYYMCMNCQSHPEFTKRAGTQNDDGTFIPST